VTGIFDNRYCNNDQTCFDTGLCGAKLKLGDACGTGTGYQNCPANMQCAFLNKTTKAVCVGLGLSKNGITYKCAKTGWCSSLICQSAFSLAAPNTETYTCLTAPFNVINEGKITDGHEMGYQCTTFNHDNTNDINHGKNIDFPAKCGFNQSPMAYCDFLIGDPSVQDGIKELYSKVNASEPVCNVGRAPMTVDDFLNCKDFVRVVGSK
jgi:hypothetical protein